MAYCSSWKFLTIIFFVVNFAEIYDGEIILKNQKLKQNLNIFIQNITSKTHSNLNTTEHGVSAQKVYVPQSPWVELTVFVLSQTEDLALWEKQDPQNEDYFHKIPGSDRQPLQKVTLA